MLSGVFPHIESWYEKTSLDYMEETDSIYLSSILDERGTLEEFFSIKWFSCGGKSVRLEIFNDA